MSRTTMTRNVALCTLTIAALAGCGTQSLRDRPASAVADPAGTASQALGPQYSTTHVYVPPGSVAALGQVWLALFGGTATAPATVTVTPTPSTALWSGVRSPIGSLSIFGYTSGVPYPFGSERTGWMVKNIEVAVTQAVAAGAPVIVAPFKDAVGHDAVVQFPGGANSQLYSHDTFVAYPPLKSVPTRNVYEPVADADAFVTSMIRFTKGHVVWDHKAANGALLGRPGKPFRQIRLATDYGYVNVNATDGKVPYPFGHEVTDFRVENVPALVERATARGVSVLSPVTTIGRRTQVVLGFPGGWMAEFSAVAPG